MPSPFGVDFSDQASIGVGVNEQFGVGLDSLRAKGHELRAEFCYLLNFQRPCAKATWAAQPYWSQKGLYRILFAFVKKNLQRLESIMAAQVTLLSFSCYDSNPTNSQNRR
jgi:hypothetical protein